MLALRSARSLLVLLKVFGVMFAISIKLALILEMMNISSVGTITHLNSSSFRCLSAQYIFLSLS